MRRLVPALLLALIAATALADDRPLDALVAEYEAFSLAQDRAARIDAWTAAEGRPG